jgi:hypothetical protein
MEHHVGIKSKDLAPGDLVLTQIGNWAFLIIARSHDTIVYLSYNGTINRHHFCVDDCDLDNGYFYYIACNLIRGTNATV